jgi:hypothetical protein
MLVRLMIVRLTLRLTDAGARRKPKLIYPNHRLAPWPTENATRDRPNRLLDGRPIPDTFICASFCNNCYFGGTCNFSVKKKYAPKAEIE